MRIFHIATVTDWESARSGGSYTTSTRGRTLAEEGFIHASRGDQWQGVRERYYADVTEPLVLLVLDTTLLTSPVVEEPAPGSTETFPHVYGPLDVAAVVQVIPLGDPLPAERGGPATPASATPVGPSFSRLFLEEMFRNVVLAGVVLVCVVVATLVGLAVADDWGPITGAAVGLVVGLVVVRLLSRRRAV